MNELARLTLRGRLGQVVALAVTVAFSAVLVGAFGLLVDTGLRGRVSTGEYHEAPLLVGARGSVPVAGDADLPIPDRALLPASVVDDIERQLPTARVVADRIVPAALAPGGGSTQPVDAHPWSALALGQRTLSAGRAPAAPDEIVVPGHLARSQGLGVGDAVDVGFGDEAADLTVVGTTTADDTGIDVPDVYLTDEQVEAHARPDDPVAVIGVWPSEDTDAAVLRDTVAEADAVLWDRGDRGPIEVVAQSQAKATLVSAAAPTAVIAVIVAVFTIIALTSLQIRGRSRELATLRILGATPKQVTRLLRAEIRLVAAVAGFAGGIAGPLVGASMVGAIRSWGVLPRTLAPVFGPVPFVLAMLTGLVAAEVAARFALRGVVRGSPLVQLEGAEGGSARSPRPVLRTVLGLALLAGAIAMALAPVYTSNVEVASALPGVSGLVMALSIGPLSPWAVRAASGVVRRRASRTAPAYLALQSIGHRRARVGGALAPIVLGVTLSAVQFSSAATFDAVAAAQRDAGSRAELTVTSSGTGISGPTAAVVRDLPGVEAATPFVTSGVVAQVVGRDTTPQALPALAVADDEVDRYADLDPKDGGPLQLRQGEVALGVQGAAQLGAHVGDEVTIVLPDGRTISRRVAARYERGFGFGEVLLPIGDLQPATASGSASGLAITVAGSASLPEVEQRIRDLLTDRPGLDVDRAASDGAGGGSGGEGNVQLLLLVVLFGYIAIAVTNSLIVAILARRPEFALLAIVGATPSQRRRALRWEAVFLATAACIIGTAFALPGLIAMTHALSDGDRIVPAIDPGLFTGLVASTFVLTLGVTALAGRAIMQAPRR